MRRTTRGSSIVAIRRIRPPQFGHASTSTAKTLWSRSAQRQRGGGAPLAGGPAGCADTAPDPASAAVGTSAAIPGGAEQGVAAGPGVASDVVTTTSATGPWTDISAYDTNFTISSSLAASGTLTLYFRIQTPTSTASITQYSSTLTVTAQ